MEKQALFVCREEKQNEPGYYVTAFMLKYSRLVVK